MREVFIYNNKYWVDYMEADRLQLILLKKDNCLKSFNISEESLTSGQQIPYFAKTLLELHYERLETFCNNLKEDNENHPILIPLGLELFSLEIYIRFCDFQKNLKTHHRCEDCKCKSCDFYYKKI